jgi:hypothetical protein
MTGRRLSRPVYFWITGMPLSNPVVIDSTPMIRRTGRLLSFARHCRPDHEARGRMSVDDLTTPLGQRPAQRRREFPVSVPKVIAVALALFLAAFVAWAVVSDDPFGGEPKVAVPIDQRGLAAANKSDAPAPQSAITATSSQQPALAIPAAPAATPPTAPPPGTKTVTIIDGKTGVRREIFVPLNNDAALPGANNKGAKQ